jgi:hypothetical protein
MAQRNRKTYITVFVPPKQLRLKFLQPPNNYFPAASERQGTVMVREMIDGTYRQTNLLQESTEYLNAREELRNAEIELMRQRERVAELRRELPKGATIQDYEFWISRRRVEERFTHRLITARKFKRRSDKERPQKGT